MQKNSIIFVAGGAGLSELYFNVDKPDGTMLKLTDPSKLHQLGWHHKIEHQDGIKVKILNF